MVDSCHAHARANRCSLTAQAVPLDRVHLFPKFTAFGKEFSSHSQHPHYIECTYYSFTRTLHSIQDTKTPLNMKTLPLLWAGRSLVPMWARYESGLRFAQSSVKCPVTPVKCASCIHLTPYTSLHTRHKNSSQHENPLTVASRPIAGPNVGML